MRDNDYDLPKGVRLHPSAEKARRKIIRRAKALRAGKQLLASHDEFARRLQQKYLFHLDIHQYRSFVRQLARLRELEESLRARRLAAERDRRQQRILAECVVANRVPV